MQIMTVGEGEEMNEDAASPLVCGHKKKKK